METILRKSGYDATPLEEALRAFDHAPEDERVQLAPGLEVIKWSLQKVQYDLSRPLMGTVLPLKIAFEFLALHLGNAIYSVAPQLTEIRQALRSGDEASDAFHVERLHTEEYQPFHGLCFEGNDPHARVQIQLFGWLAFRVHFHRLAVGGPRLVYTHNLESNQEGINVINDSGVTL